jgi:glutaredoxin
MQRVAFALLATLFAGSAAAELYRWVDAEGKVHYTDQPPAGATRVEAHRATANVVTGTTPYAVQQATKNFPVKLYTGTNCGSPCEDTRGLLGKRGVPFTEVSVTQPAHLDELKRVSGGEEVPIVLVGRAVLKGFEPTSLNAALDDAGYPRHATRNSQAMPKPSSSGNKSMALPGSPVVAAPGSTGNAETNTLRSSASPDGARTAQTDTATGGSGPYAPR